MVITFEELRRVKDQLPSGSMLKIAKELGVDADAVRNFFGGTHFDSPPPDVHFEQGGLGGGVVRIENPAIWEAAQRLIGTEINE